jgi:DNA-directed RNA polymerase specialized sigma24 family protein
MRPELIQAADLLRRDSPRAVEEAIGLLQNTVYSFSMKVRGHPEDAEDTRQEVLFRLLEVPCDPGVAKRLRAILTKEYLRLLGSPSGKEQTAAAL